MFKDLITDIPLPYNIEESDLADWSITAEVFGNYELISTTVYVSQLVNGVMDNLDGAKLVIDWTNTGPVSHWPFPPCRPDIWTGTFHLWDCNNPILAHSSYYPDMLNPECDLVGEIGPEDLIDPGDKIVFFDLEHTIHGCDEFVAILAQKEFFLEPPTL